MNATILGLIVRRIGVNVLILLIVSVIVFAATLGLPGDFAEEILGQAATPELLAAMRQEVGADLPAWQRYLVWLGGLLTGDPGLSLINRASVAQLIGQRLPNSLLLASLVTLVSVPLALTLGVTAAMRQGSRYDRFVSSMTVSMVSVPEFLVATVAVIVFAVQLRWLPALSTINEGQPFLTTLRSLTLPIWTLTCLVVAQMARLTRAAVVNTLRSPYIEMAVLKGASQARVVALHALPNAVGPIANAVALSLSSLLGGVVVVETIFNYPGLARLMVDAVSTRDIPIVLACAMIFCTGYLVLVTIADILAIVSNPRLRYR